MAVTDPIADFLTRIRNGLQADHDVVDIPASGSRPSSPASCASRATSRSYATEPARVGEVLRVTLKYTEDRQPVISGIKRVSTPGRRTYVDSGEIPKVLGGMGTAIMSTSSGVMTGHDARRQGVGGEVVAYVW